MEERIDNDVPHTRGDEPFWGSEYDRAGKIYASTNAGAVRLLLPRSKFTLVNEWRSSMCVILSRGPWPAAGLPDAVEILWEDGTDTPYALHLSPESFDMLPGEPEPGREWIISAWVLKARLCYVRTVECRISGPE